MAEISLWGKQHTPVSMVLGVPACPDSRNRNSCDGFFVPLVPPRHLQIGDRPMKVIVASDNVVVGNIVRGAFQEMRIANMEIVPVKTASQVEAETADDAVVLVDWEMAPEVGAGIVAAARKKSEKAPILLLCPMTKAGTTFIGMKAGASGIINKPIVPDELVRVVVNAVKKAKTKGLTVNVEFINPFIDAVRNVFSTMCNMKAERKKLFLKDDYRMLGDISGVMGLTGEASGCVVVSMPKKLACTIVGRMLGEKPGEELDGDVRDGIAEIINVISGQAKASLVKTKYHFALSIPSVVVGPDHEISVKKGTPNIVVLFETEGQTFAVQVCLAPGEGGENNE